MQISLCQREESNPRIPSVFWILKSEDFQERKSFDMLGISYEFHPRPKRILMPERWIGWFFILLPQFL